MKKTKTRKPKVKLSDGIIEFIIIKKIHQSCFARYSGFIKMNAKPRRIAFTTQRFDTPSLVSSSGVI